MTPDDPRHGTPAGYHQHRADDEDACTPCLDGIARYERGRQHDHLNGRARIVPAIGSQRRLQALIALGYTWKTLADHLGVERTNLRRFAYRVDQDVMTARMATRITRTYDALSMVVPTATRGRQSRAIHDARSVARAAGWAPPLAWDDVDIDDPTAVPHTGPTSYDDDLVDDVVIQRILDGDPSPAKTATAAERRAVVAAWLATGRPGNELGRLTGWKWERYVDRTRRTAA